LVYLEHELCKLQECCDRGEVDVMNKPMSNLQQACLLTAVLTITLSYLHWDSFNPTLAQFNNDHPLGLMAEWQRADSSEFFSKGWNDNNWLGFDQDGRPVTFTWLLLFIWKYPILILAGVLTLLCTTIYGMYIGIKQLTKK
jgi:ABC-type dipeptide/oligopeptide/nickel transport system permease subunit